MNSTLAYLRSRRAWLVENLSVWGSDSEAEFLMAVSETVASDKRVGFWNISLGGQLQEVAFADLSDSRSNQLPETINRPAIVIIPRGKRGAFIKTVNGETGFHIAKNDNGNSPVIVDLMIFESGL
jgi:hypothetical protein